MPQAPSMQVPRFWPLVTQPNNRASTFLKDARLVNCYAEKDPDDGYQIQKRFGTGAPVYSLPAGQAYGMYRYTFVKQDPTTRNFNIQHYLLMSVLSSTKTASVYFVGPGTTTPTLMAHVTVGSSLSKIQFASIPGYNNFTGALFFTNGTQAYWFFGPPVTLQVPGGPVAIPRTADGGTFPNNTVPGIAYLDGVVYVMDPVGNIWGSNLQDPSTWNVLNVIQANAEPDGGIALAKQLIYVVAIKEWTTQFFFDDGNSTGSPLSPVPGALLPYGCLSGDTLAEIDGILLWVTSSKTNSPQVIRLENLHHEMVSTPAIERQLDLSYTSSTFYAWALKHGGHRLYILTNKTSNVTLAYDIDQKLWYQWNDSNGNYYPLVAQAFDVQSTSSQLAQHETNGNIYPLDIDSVYPTDNGTIFPVDIYTPNIDFQIFRDKTLNTIYFDADMNNGSFIQSRYSDDDYQTWSNFRTTSLAVRKSYMTDEGTFWRRAYHFRHANATPFRITSVGLEMDIGSK